MAEILEWDWRVQSKVAACPRYPARWDKGLVLDGLGNAETAVSYTHASLGNRRCGTLLHSPTPTPHCQYSWSRQVAVAAPGRVV